MTKSTPLILIVGKSGSGKSAIVSELCEQFGLTAVQSYTTREPRYNGEQGHIFATIDDYIKAKASGNIVAETLYCGNRYWSTQEQMNEADFYILDVNGIDTFEQRYNGEREVINVYIKTPLHLRLKWLLKRDGFKKAVKRIVNDFFAFWGVENKVDYIVNNRRDGYAYIAETNICYIIAGRAGRNLMYGTMERGSKATKVYRK